MFGQWVQVEFECMPLRSISRLDVPVDASPMYEAFVKRVKLAMATHGTHNAYFLHRGTCVYHLTNDPSRGEVRFAFEGTVLTDTQDLHTRTLDLTVTLDGETCPWLNEPIVDFLAETVKHSVLVEFDRYIAAGDIEKTEQRIRDIQQQSDSSDGYMGMYL